MECNTCKHEFVCKYKEAYIKVTNTSNSKDFKGVFNIYCNEYLKCKECPNRLSTSIKGMPYYVHEEDELSHSRF